MQGSLSRIAIVIGIILLSIIILALVYKSIANPLKNLSKAVNSIDYGKTLVEIPYYLNDELGFLCRNFEEMGRRLKKSENNQQELIQAISHDIKTPLTSIIGYSKRLAEDKVKESKKEKYFEIIHKKANDLKFLLEELEDYSNINVQSKYIEETVNIFESFEKFCYNLKTELENKDINFTYYNELNPSINLVLDKKKMKRVFMNLIQNSFKYAGENCTLIIKGISNEKSLSLEVTDNGSGVSNDQLDKIFDRFYRVESSRSREKGGTGLGLTICKDIVEYYGGTIYARNLPNNGGFSIVINCNFNDKLRRII